MASISSMCESSSPMRYTRDELEDGPYASDLSVGYSQQSTDQQRASVESTWGSLSVQTDAEASTDLMGPPLEVVQEGRQADVAEPPAAAPSPAAARQKKAIAYSILAALLMTVALACVYTGSRYLLAGPSRWLPELDELERVSAHALSLAVALRDPRAAELTEDFETSLAVLQSELLTWSSSGKEAAKRPAVSFLSAAQRESLQRAVEQALQLTASLGELTRVSLEQLLEDVTEATREIDEKAACLSGVAKSLRTDAAQADTALASHMVRAVRRDERTLQVMLQEVQKLQASAPLTVREAAQRLEATLFYVDQMRAISSKMKYRTKQVGEWRSASLQLVSAHCLVEGSEITRRIHELVFNATCRTALSSGDSAAVSELLHELQQRQEKAGNILASIQSELCPIRTLELLHHMQEAGEEAETLFGRLERHTAPAEEPRERTFFLELADASVRTLLIQEAAVNELVLSAAAAAHDATFQDEEHAPLQAAISDSLLHSEVLEERAGIARGALRRAKEGKGLQKAVAGLQAVEKLRKDGHEIARKALQSVAACNAWSHMNTAVHEAIGSMRAGLQALAESAEGTGGPRAKRLLLENDINAKLTRYAQSTQIRQGKTQAIGILQTASRLETIKRMHDGNSVRGLKGDDGAGE
ncbi:hypothetical protein Efla_003256 [Eimeria flavescens]